MGHQERQELGLEAKERQDKGDGDKGFEEQSSDKNRRSTETMTKKPKAGEVFVNKEYMVKLAMPKHGKFPYHCLGHHLGQQQQQIRDTMIGEAQNHWKQIAPWDEGDELQGFLQNSENPKQWGNAYHIALAT